MYVQLSAVIVDADLANRQELANFLTSFGPDAANTGFATAPGATVPVYPLNTLSKRRAFLCPSVELLFRQASS